MPAHVIRPAIATDMSTVLELIQEMSDLKNGPDKAQLTLDDLLRDGGFDPTSTDKPAYFDCFVAEQSGQIVGFTMSFFVSISRAYRSLYIDSLHVRRTLPPSLRADIERDLADTLRAFGRENGCLRAAFHSKPDSDLAAMWQELGAVDITQHYGVRVLRLPSNGIDALINDKVMVS